MQGSTFNFGFSGISGSLPGEPTRMVKILMRPVDGSMSIHHPNVPDNKRIDYGKSSALDLTGIAARYPCLDDSFLMIIRQVFSQHTP